MEDFYFGGHWLSEFGGRLTQEPRIEIAERDTELIEIPGKSGDVFLDNNRYKNVPFSRPIGFANRQRLPTAQQMDKVIDWLAYQIGYKNFRDTQHPQAFTRAILQNMNEVLRDLPALFTTTLNFNREPFWYSDEGQVFIELPTTSNSITLKNPYKLGADPDYRIYAKPCTTDIYIGSVKYSGINFTTDYPCFSVDREQKQIMLANYDTGQYKPIQGEFPIELSAESNNTITFTFSLTNFHAYKERILVKPNWRFL